MSCDKAHEHNELDTGKKTTICKNQGRVTDNFSVGGFTSSYVERYLNRKSCKYASETAA